MSLVTLSPYGFHLPAADLYLDARRAPGTVFVSHAHTDHCTDAARIVCTPATATLHKARRTGNASVTMRFHEPTRLNDATITLLPAGHALGAAMLVSESAEGTVAYTGDFKLRPNPFAPPVTIPRCDTLIMESTFGDPRYVFPPDAQLLARAFAFADDTLRAGGVPVFLAYALGKAQEMIYQLTTHGYQVMVHSAISTLCQLHVALGHPFPGPGKWMRYKRGNTAGRVVVTMPSTRKSVIVQSLEKRRVCHLTGWAYHPNAAAIYKGCDLMLPLSDHADWNDLVRMATESGAKKVYTVNGHEALAAHLRTLGVDAEHVATHAALDAESDDTPEAVSVAPSAQIELGW